MLSKMLKFTKRKNILLEILLLLIILYFVTQYFMMGNREGFETESESEKPYSVKTNVNEIYDKFYSNIYDQLLYDDKKNGFELGKLIEETKPKKASAVFIDLGSGTGIQSHQLQEMGYTVTGVDKSSDMVSFAKKHNPKGDYVKGDVTDVNTFPREHATHAMCLYFTIYYIQNKRGFFQNVFHWLRPGGYFALHLVNRNMFDPILPPGNPLMFVNAQKYAKERMTKTKVKFNNYTYQSNFILDKENNKTQFIEDFIDKKGKRFRKHEHTLYMEHQRHILNLAKESGFIFVSKSDMITCQYEYQYLYILQKPF